jgi:hypothetical protein
MAISLASISKTKSLKAPRIILLGVEKIGKSTWASQTPAPIFLPVRQERGLDNIDTQAFPVIQNYDEAVACIGTLLIEEHQFKTVVIDSASSLEPLVWDQACRDNPVAGKPAASIEKIGGGYGKGYIEATKYWRDLLEGLDALRDEKGMGVVIVGHTKVKSVNDPMVDPYDSYIWDIHQAAANLLYRWADVTLFAKTRSFVKTVDEIGDKKTRHGIGGTDRICYTQKRDAHPGGSRFDLPYELPFTYAAFAAALDNARK